MNRIDIHMQESGSNTKKYMQYAPGANPQVLCIGRALPIINENRNAATATHGAGLSPRAEALKDNCRLSGVRGDHPNAPGGGAAVPPQTGVDVDIS